MNTHIDYIRSIVDATILELTYNNIVVTDVSYEEYDDDDLFYIAFEDSASLRREFEIEVKEKITILRVFNRVNNVRKFSYSDAIAINAQHDTKEIAKLARISAEKAIQRNTRREDTKRVLEDKTISVLETLINSLMITNTRFEHLQFTSQRNEFSLHFYRLFELDQFEIVVHVNNDLISVYDSDEETLKEFAIDYDNLSDTTNNVLVYLDLEYELLSRYHK